MPPIPANDLRSNLGTWAVPMNRAPAVAHLLTECLPLELYDPAFHGQDLETTYFDTARFDLLKARKQGTKYLTLRVRCYQPGGTYALSAKTEKAKFRLPLDAATADQLLTGGINAGLSSLLPADLLARLLELTDGQALAAVTTICFRRYAVEDDIDRLTFDVDVRTDAGKRLAAGVLEFKSQYRSAAPPAEINALELRPIKLSKFLWATRM